MYPAGFRAKSGVWLGCDHHAVVCGWVVITKQWCVAWLSSPSSGVWLGCDHQAVVCGWVVMSRQWCVAGL